MLLTRTTSLVLRLLQFLFSAIVLGLVASFIHDRHEYPSQDDLFNRLIYILIIACLSLVLSLLWMLPTTSAIMHWIADFLFAAAWISVFAILQGWYSTRIPCGGQSDWAHVWVWGSACGKWNAAQAFAFLAAGAWFVSFVLGLLLWAKRDAVGGRDASAVPAGRRRRWFRSSAV